MIRTDRFRKDTLTPEEIAYNVQQATGLPDVVAREMVWVVFEAYRDLITEDPVSCIQGFGTFRLKNHSWYGLILKFRATKGLERELNP